jgi:hypothetical protein
MQHFQRVSRANLLKGAFDAATVFSGIVPTAPSLVRGEKQPRGPETQSTQEIKTAGQGSGDACEPALRPNQDDEKAL